MAVSFLSGKVVYVSPQGSSLLRCKTECLQGTVFSELLAPQDVSTFYSGTAPCRLPPWASCIGSGEQTLGDIWIKLWFYRSTGSNLTNLFPTLIACSIVSCRLYAGEVHVLPHQCQTDAGWWDALLSLSSHTLPTHHQRLGCGRASALLLAHCWEGPLRIWRFVPSVNYESSWKVSYHIHFQILIFHPGLQWSSLTQWFIQKTC